MIEKYIFSLLETNNRVIVPDFGAFLKGTGSSKNIFFNEFIKVDDGLLITSIIENEKISRNEATQEIAEFIEVIKKELSEKQKSNIKGMGVLFMDEKGRIRLEVDEKAIKENIPDKLAMSKAVGKKKDNKEKVIVIPDSKITKKQTAMENTTPPKKENTPPKKKKQKTLLIVLLILIPIIILLVLGYLYQDKIFSSSADKKVVKKEVVKTEIEKQKAAEVLAKEKAKIAVEEKAKIVAKEKAKKELEQKQKKYYLVGGVFKEIQNSKDLLSELEYDGFSDVKYVEIGGLNYLYFNSYDSFSKAKTQLQNIKDKGYEVWIFKH